MEQPERGAPSDVTAAEVAYAKRVGALLRAAREARGWSLRDVWSKSGGQFTASAVGSYERGTRLVSISRLHSLAQVYGVPVSRVLPDDSAATGRRGDRHRGRYESRPRHEPDIVLDLTALERAGDPHLGPLRRYVETIQTQRHALGTDSLTMRGGDMPALAAAASLDVDGLVHRLRTSGVLRR